MALQAGNYTIRCKADNYLIGRHTAEDRSLHPKRILALEHHQEIPIWEFERTQGPNHYIFKTRGTPTASIDGFVYALLVDDVPPTVWEIKLHPIFGMNYYTIAVASDPGVGWAAPDRDQENGNGQIAIKPITLEPGFPLPQIPSNMLFIIREVE